MQGWGVTNLRGAVIDTRGRSQLEVRLGPGDKIDQDQDIYWVAPNDYLNNKVGKETCLLLKS